MTDTKRAQRLAEKLRQLRCDARSAENGLAVRVRLRGVDRDCPELGLHRYANPTLVWLPDPQVCDAYVWNEGACSELATATLEDVAHRVRATLRVVEERYEPEGAER